MIKKMQMPEKVQIEETSSPAHSRFIMQPLEHGYASTVGNAMRRVLISSIQGAAITGIKIVGVLHEYQGIPHVVEDLAEIILNLKEVKIKTDEEKPLRITFRLQGAREWTARDIQDASPLIEVVNPDFHIATLSSQASVDVELRIGQGNGYVPANEQTQLDWPVGMQPIDSIFTPILRVNYIVEPFRVGTKTDYERLVLDVRTDGTLSADEAVHTAAKILNDHFRLYSSFEEYNEQEEIKNPLPADEEEKVQERKRIKTILLTPISQLQLSVRTNNCLKNANVNNIADLVQYQESDLLKFRNFGQKSFTELKELVEMHRLKFGMNVDQYLKEEVKSPTLIDL